MKKTVLGIVGDPGKQSGVRATLTAYCAWFGSCRTESDTQPEENQVLGSIVSSEGGEQGREKVSAKASLMAHRGDSLIGKKLWEAEDQGT